ncbi:ABC transporter ATP-binding protein [Parvibaculum sp.]|uniref:ABC transporter ATP-binding protein n=1 Tax=Parvibaculum sp. TaxID=2024848 RepID=UPI00320F5F5E
MAAPILAVEHLTIRFGGLVAIDDLSFEAGVGDITALIGPNGAGKTTVFNCITGFYKPDVGRMTFRRDAESYLLERMDGFRIARAGVVRTFQNIRLFPGMSAIENLMIAQHVPLMRASLYSVAGFLRLRRYLDAEKQAIERARYWLDKTDLLAQADLPAGSLPYGAQRRLEIARAMCAGPSLLCLDEPAAGLNPRESLALNELLLSIRQEHGISILLIEHDMSVVMQISDRIIVLEQGRKISQGTPDEVRADPEVIRAYLGVEDDAAAVAVLTARGTRG